MLPMKVGLQVHTRYILTPRYIWNIRILFTNTKLITVLSLPMLLFMLGNSSMEGQAQPSINNFEAALEKEQFMFMDMGPGEGGVPDPLCSLMWSE